MELLEYNVRMDFSLLYSLWFLNAFIYLFVYMCVRVSIAVVRVCVNNRISYRTNLFHSGVNNESLSTHIPY